MCLLKLPPSKDTLNLKLYQCLKNHFKYVEKQNSKNSGLSLWKLHRMSSIYANAVLPGPHSLGVIGVDGLVSQSQFGPLLQVSGRGLHLSH